MKPTLFGLNPQKFSLKKCLIFFPENTFLKKCVFAKERFLAQALKTKKSTQRKILMLQETEMPKNLFFSQSSFYISGKNFLCLKIKKKKIILFLYKEAKFSKTKCFFLLYKIFFHIQQMFAFHLLRHFCNVQDHIVNFFLFLL